MSDRVESNFSKPEVNSYLTENKLQESYSILKNQLTLTRTRVTLLKENLDRWRSLIQQPIKQPDILTSWIAKIHMIQLDIISMMFMLFEDFLIYSYNLRGNLSDLPRSTASENRVVWAEIKNIEKVDNASSISEYLLFPNVEQLQLTHDEKQFVRKMLDKMTLDIKERIASTTKFFHDFNRIYIRYKHALPAIIAAICMFLRLTKTKILQIRFSNQKIIAAHTVVLDEQAIVIRIVIIIPNSNPNMVLDSLFLNVYELLVQKRITEKKYIPLFRS